MITISIAAGSVPEMLEVAERAQKELAPKLSEKLSFICFDARENIDQEGLWTYRGCASEAVALNRAVACTAKGEAQILFKGITTTHDLLKEVLNKDHQLKEQEALSHVSWLNIDRLRRPVLLTDAAMNITPDAHQLGLIVENAVRCARQIGITRPKVAMLSAAENFNPKMPSSVLAKQAAEDFSDNPSAIVEGPISLDLALSKEAVAHKHYEGRIQGDADILVVPSIDVGNVLYKAILLFADATVGGTIIGAKVPIVLTSRSDAVKSKLAALEFALQQVIGGR